MKKEIVRLILEMSGKYTPYEIFSDWIAACAISIQNSCVLFHDGLYKKREEQYLGIAGKYSEKELMNFSRMTAELADSMETEGMTDVLGEIFMETGCGNGRTGQFFTPFHISQLSAEVAFQLHHHEENNVIEINEPSCGAGGMIIACAKILKKRGVNYQRCMKVVAQDLDWKSVYMTYIQLSLLGIRAKVVQGNTLTEPYAAGYEKERVFFTPAEMGALI